MDIRNDWRAIYVFENISIENYKHIYDMNCHYAEIRDAKRKMKHNIIAQQNENQTKIQREKKKEE